VEEHTSYKVVLVDLVWNHDCCVRVVGLGLVDTCSVWNKISGYTPAQSVLCHCQL